MENKNIYYMKLALAEAEKAYIKGEIPVGAIIVQNGKVIARGHNLKENSCCAVKHAEIIAIEKACAKLKNWRLIGCTMYVTMFPVLCVQVQLINQEYLIFIMVLFLNMLKKKLWKRF